MDDCDFDYITKSMEKKKWVGGDAIVGMQHKDMVMILHFALLGTQSVRYDPTNPPTILTQQQIIHHLEPHEKSSSKQASKHWV
jgi:hypothetical protein